MTDLNKPSPQNIIGQRIPILDKGWIELVDLMPHPTTGVPGDLAIVNAARVSFLGESKGPVADKKLLFYLIKHHHTSPFEMVEFKFRVHAPVVTFWQWVRHRTWCLSGDTELYFDLPQKLRKGQKTAYKVKLSDLQKRWEGGTISRHVGLKTPGYAERIDPEKVYTVRELSILVERNPCTIRNLAVLGSLKTIKCDGLIKVIGQDWIDYIANAVHELNAPMKDRINKMKLRMCNEDTGEIEHTSIIDIVQSGLKPVFKVTLANGYSIKMSKDHRVLTSNGWQTLEQATGLKFTRLGNVVWNAASPMLATNGVPAYKDKDWLYARRTEGLNVTEMAERAGVSYHTIWKYLGIHRLQFTSKEKSALSGKAQRGQKRIVVVHTRHTSTIKGARSHFWKGGITSERALIGRWTTQMAPEVHRKFDYKCAVCAGTSGNLHAHHIDPVWHNIDKAYDKDNLVTLCAKCHSIIHSHNLELVVLKAWEDNQSLYDIQTLLKTPGVLPVPVGKKPHGGQRIVRKYVEIKTIEYCGEEPTYDVSVSGPYRNFIANGFVVHNSFNASSGRYTPFEEDSFYVPSVWRKQAKDNKQASEGVLEDEYGQPLTDKLIAHYEAGFKLYQEALKAGVAKEMARLFLPGFSVYYTWVAKIDAHNLMQFLRLRMASDAQYEIRVYADAIYEHFFKTALPWTAEAFDQFVMNAEKTGSDK